MRFNLLSATERQRRRLMLRQIKWKVTFAWWPVRVSPLEVQWLCSVARRDRGLIIHQGMSIFERIIVRWNRWEYGPVTNALTQPGTEDGNTAFSNSISSSKVGGAAVQGGPSNALGIGSQNVQASQNGAAHAGVAAQGGNLKASP